MLGLWAQNAVKNHRDGDEKIEQMAALAWSIRAQEVCERADVLIEEGVPNEEVRDILRVEPE